MERISKALELARSQREARWPMHEDAQRRDRRSVEAAMSHDEADRGALDQQSQRAPFELGDTLAHCPPVIELDPQLRERERILTPGCPGVLGMPYKMLRTQVLKRLDQSGANSLAVISAAAGVGKTLTAINLAIAIASDSGRTALLVDFDLRNPSIHKRLGYEPKIGVEDCLGGRLPIHRAMFKIAGYDRLTVLAARERVERSSDLLRSQRAADIMLEMRARYANRVLVFDLPPVLQSDDALAFSQYVQAGLVVVGEGNTRRDDVERTLQLLRDLPIVGTVLNGSREPSPNYY